MLSNSHMSVIFYHCSYKSDLYSLFTSLLLKAGVLIIFGHFLGFSTSKCKTETLQDHFVARLSVNLSFFLSRPMFSGYGKSITFELIANTTIRGVEKSNFLVNKIKSYDHLVTYFDAPKFQFYRGHQ